MTVAIICLTILVTVVIVILAVLIYNQMLLVNQINKRLLLLSLESRADEDASKQQLQDALIELERQANEMQSEPRSGVEEEKFEDSDLDL